MSQRKIKSLIRPQILPTGTYEQDIQEDFRVVCTLIDELQAWAEKYAPVEVQMKLAALKSYTVTTPEGKAN